VKTGKRENLVCIEKNGLFQGARFYLAGAYLRKEGFVQLFVAA
jgi:hypothetical protein